MIKGLNEETRRTRIKRLAAFLPALFMMAAIFTFSAQPAEESSEASELFGSAFFSTVNNLLGFGWDLQRIMVVSEGAQHAIRKAAHFAEYMALGAALYFGFLVNLPEGDAKEKESGRSVLAALRRPAAARILLALSVAALFAASDEIHQLFVPGRAGMLQDVAVDCLGAFCGVLLFALLHHRRVSRR